MAEKKSGQFSRRSIIELNKFDVVLATHSPQLIGQWDNHVVDLGDVYEGNREEDGIEI